jgi:hypothetical protein
MQIFQHLNKKSNLISVSDFKGCQLTCIPKFAIAAANHPDQSVYLSLKRILAYPWNSYVKRELKKIYYFFTSLRGPSAQQIAATAFISESLLVKGDFVRVRSLEEINSTLDAFKELKGCAFLPEMYQYCGTVQRVFKSMQHFMDERDYKLKKTRGLILLENNFCTGTPVFGRCDRSCFLFWREEWLEKIRD